MFMTIMVCALVSQQEAPLIGVIADDLVDHSQWVAPHRDVWSGDAVVRLLESTGCKARLLTRDDLHAQALSRYTAILVATDNAYPERGPWGGPVSKALVDYVRQGGIYVMAAGIPHYAAYDVDSGALDQGHFDDFFGLKGTTTAGQGSLSLTHQGRGIGLASPEHVKAKAARVLSFPKSAVLVWDRGFNPVLSAAPFEKGWLIHWGGGPEGGMDQSVRDFLIPTMGQVVQAIRAEKLTPQTRQELYASEGLEGKSLDDLDREVFRPGPAPLSSEPVTVALETIAPGSSPVQDADISLDGSWRMLGLPKGQGDARALAFGVGWAEAVNATIPCSVQSALFAAGLIDDPVVGFNDQPARREVADKEWWFRKDFSWKPGGRTRLVFDGVDYSATFFLNGTRLGEHEGPFGGPEFEVTGLLRRENSLVVRLDPLPPDWTLAFKTNCVYGWHYVNCPPIGIWQSVRLEAVPDVEIREVFVAATDAVKGAVDVYVALNGPESGYSGVIAGIVKPANFEGPHYRFSLPVETKQPRVSVHARFFVPHPQLWWPVDLGPQNLYDLGLSFHSDNLTHDATWTRFGIRTIAMAPLPDGPRPDRYNWTFVINGRPAFLKGCNWATTDAFLRLTPDRYRRFLTMARDEHIQIMRSWGGGLLETDTFYDLCDELGIMVWQEFPLTWQKFDLLRPAVSDEIAVRNVMRLRNRASLVMWCGGNEHSGEGPLIELLGRRCLELDGTRPFHRTDPYGGSLHNYDVYWGKQPMDAYLRLTPFDGGPAVIGETGLASACAVESTLRFLPDAEKRVWPPTAESVFVHHTPTFTIQNMDHLNLQAKQFDPCLDLEGFTRGTQLAQATGLRLAIDRMRVAWPRATAMVFYKLTDVFPGCSWSTVDYFGVPKIAHYIVQDAYAPGHVVATFEELDLEPGTVFTPRLFVVDDNAGWFIEEAHVTARLYDADLSELSSAAVTRDRIAGAVTDLGAIELPISTDAKAPYLLKVDMSDGARLVDRSVYWFNYRQEPGCLFRLPTATLDAHLRDNSIAIVNTGQVPAVSVHFDAPEASDSLRYTDAYFWLDPGESVEVGIQCTPNVDGEVREPATLQIRAWNVPPFRVRR